MGDHLCIGPDLICVWKGGTDLGPVENPGAHPTRTRFHSKQENIGFYPTPHTGTYTNTTWPTGEVNSRKITLFAHGLSYRPFLAGSLTVAGTELPINGSIPHQMSTVGFRAYTIGADATNVYLNILRSYRQASGIPPSPTISYKIYLSVYGVNANGSIHRPTFFNGVDANAGASPSYIRAGYFDTRLRYPYKDASGVLAVPDGRTMSTGIGWVSGSGFNGVVALGYRYSVLGLVQQRNASSLAPLGASVFLGNSSSFNASVTRISL